jgi:hypothetical protein
MNKKLQAIDAIKFRLGLVAKFGKYPQFRKDIIEQIHEISKRDKKFQRFMKKLDET